MDKKERIELLHGKMSIVCNLVATNLCLTDVREKASSIIIDILNELDAIKVND